ncbi:MAG: hypothetical protein ACLFPL_05180 [Candidatus Nanoarchaeia archaeon]
MSRREQIERRTKKKRFYDYFFKSTFGLKILENYKKSNLIDDLNDYIYSKLED